jgi:hypothetical protein
MVITMSIISPFTYPNLSLCSKGVITVIHDLHVFSCRTTNSIDTCTLLRNTRAEGPSTC